MRFLNIKPKKVFIYEANGKEPYSTWLKSLPVSVRARIMARIARVEIGNLGDCISVGDGVFELKFHFGPGYRVYFGEMDDTIIILLNGGAKKFQKKDIKKAKEYWKEYISRRLI